MAKCAVCEKGAHFGNAVSHSHRRSNKIWNSNVKSVRVKVNGATKKMYVLLAYVQVKLSVPNAINFRKFISVH